MIAEPEDPEDTPLIKIGSQTIPLVEGTSTYTATTANASNKVSVEGLPEGTTATITLNSEAFTSGSTATWQDGENVITVTIGTDTYTITVTKTGG